MQLECLAYSVGHADEGVCVGMQMGPYRILLDCGLPDPSALRELFPPDRTAPVGETRRRQPVDFVLVANAHADRARGLLYLHRAFPKLPIYASEVTTELVHLNWPEVEREQTRFCQALPWQTPVEFRDGLTVQLFRAGHLPGAAAILLTYLDPDTGRPYKVLHTGDFFLSNSRLVEGLPLEQLRGLDPDVAIVEASYGTARFPHRRALENELAERINRAIAEQKRVLMPTPPLGLGQELLMLLRSHHHFTGRDLDIWVDGSVADGCDAYLALLPQLPSSVQNFARHQALFWDDRVRPRVRRVVPEERGELGKSPSIVLCDLAIDWQQYCAPDTGPWLVLLPEHPGQPRPELERAVLDRLPVPVEVETYLLTDRCDVNGTTQLIHNLHPQHVLLVRGAPNYLADLSNLDELRNRYHLHTPHAGTVVELPIGEILVQPSEEPEVYEGELTEHPGEVAMTFPEAIARDSRWQNFADTGLIEARWQGDELVIRGLSQREVLSQRSVARFDPAIDCCGTCRYYRGRRCWNRGSPLYGFKVTPDGYCPAFEALPSEGEVWEDGEPTPE